ncbi:MAG: hypothetical protein FWD25_11265, partial [Clostridia bacterium]|nr:hypothetical protein [Clostridia bacterium]
MKELDTMDQTANVSQLATLQDEIRRLQVELRTANRGLLQRDRTISVMENNFSVKMNMSRVLASENEKHKRFLAHLMRYNVDFLILLDLNLNIKYCSDIFLQKIGVKYIDEIEDKHILDVYRTFASGDLFEQIKGGIDLAIEKKEPLHVDVVADIENKNEYRAYRIIHIPIFENGLHGLIIDWSDTTDIIDAKNAAEEASKSKSRFLATMSHEIRTPLNAIIGIAQIELHRGSLPDGFATALEKINSSSNHLLGIINDILDLSKIETGK